MVAMIGDGHCHDICNNENRFKDLGDCCLDYISDEFCQVCLCHLDGLRHNSTDTCDAGMIQDGYCHDACNDFMHDYDGGDCCLSEIDDTFCINCQCHLTLIKHTSVQCNDFQIGNSKCEDECNVLQFNYDGMDCCMEVILFDWFCTSCICHLDGSRHPEFKDGCFAFEIGNGMCEEDCNTATFDYDFGDCCLETIDVVQFHNNLACQNCICHLDGTLHPYKESGCEMLMLGDGVCQDDCNHELFLFDDNDCCLNLIDDTVCEECTCHLDGSRRFSFYCSELMVGDGVCDDGCNIKHHNYDGNDCCLSVIINFNCIVCQCFEHNQVMNLTRECNPALMQDGFCHDECNVEAFDYDNFDCCLEYADLKFCSDCACHLDQSIHQTRACAANLIGDFYCHDQCNNFDNFFDGGDCCLAHVDPSECSICACHNIFKLDRVVRQCMTKYLHNFICDDECNTADYDYDFNDCCLDRIVTDFCSVCQCHLDGEFHLSETCIGPNKIGDGLCHDDCNSKGTDYDGFDCCLDYIYEDAHQATCTTCICHLDQTKHPLGCHFWEKGNGKCDDNCNNKQFEYDDMDCCLTFIDDTGCSSCTCHLDGSKHLKSNVFSNSKVF